MNKKGFTLLELLVVVLIIGILASIALPQYQMAVTKAKVASILPLMRRWKDALQEYKLQHGYYCADVENGDCPDGADLGVNWPSDWKTVSNVEADSCGDNIQCTNGYWFCDIINDISLSITCGTNDFSINMYLQNNNEDLSDKVTCSSDVSEGIKVCKALGSKAIRDDGIEVEYQL